MEKKKQPLPNNHWQQNKFNDYWTELDSYYLESRQDKAHVTFTADDLLYCWASDLYKDSNLSISSELYCPFSECSPRHLCNPSQYLKVKRKNILQGNLKLKEENNYITSFLNTLFENWTLNHQPKQPNQIPHYFGYFDLHLQRTKRHNKTNQTL